jgi:hypothetical protein
VEGAQERVLAHVLGLVVADDARRDAHDDIAMALDEPLECAEVAARYSSDEERVLLVLAERR